MSKYTGSVSLNEATPAEITLKEITLTRRMTIRSIWVDANATTRGYILRLYKKVDGTNYREIDSYQVTAVAASSRNFLYPGGPIDCFYDVKITIESVGGGSTTKTVYYEIPYDDAVDRVESAFNGTGHTDDVDFKVRSFAFINDAGDALTVTATGAGNKGINLSSALSNAILAASVAVAGTKTIQINSTNDYPVGWSDVDTEDKLEQIYSMIAGKNQYTNGGAGGAIQVQLYKYDDSTTTVTKLIKKPAGTNNTQTLDTNAMAGRA